MIQEISQILKMDNYLSNLEIKVTNASAGYVEFSVPVTRYMMRIGDIVNGGATMTLLDAAGGMAVFTLGHGTNQVTISLTSNFLKRIEHGPLKVIGKVTKKGKKVTFARMEIYDAKDDLCAEGTGSWYIF